MEKGLCLLVDIDDFLVKSSPVLQGVVNDKTNFKTEVLKMLEQLRRNCNYVVNEVTKECEEAKKEGRKPNLSKFKIFDGKTNDSSKCYTEPIDYVKYFASAANALYEHFLEERDTFLETDNMQKGARKYFDGDKEHALTIHFSDLIHENSKYFSLINEYCLNQASTLINEAISKNKDGKLTVPEFGALVSMDSNDIIKNNSIDKTTEKENKEYILYTKPIENLINCIKNERRLHDIVTNAKIFSNPVSEEIVDYYQIHRMENVNYDAVAFVKRLVREGIIDEICFSTHHNGEREEGAKRLLMRELFPEVPVDNFIGQRFHDEEHDANRRGRSSKIRKAASKMHRLPSSFVLLDDSIANCRDAQVNEALPILYKPLTDAEIINGNIEDTGYIRIRDFSEESYQIVVEAIRKRKEELKTRKVLKK